MSTTTPASATTTASALTDLQVAIEQVSLPMSERDPELVRKACEEMDAAREELRKRIGIVEVAVDLIREARQ